uniref:Uncharacterized protein n=1 Tax=Ciona intestinalis TaxID=7719 RepID=H2Y2J3_CIOIN
MKSALILLCCVLMIVIDPTTSFLSPKPKNDKSLYNLYHKQSSNVDDNLNEMRSLQQNLEKLRS